MKNKDGKAITKKMEDMTLEELFAIDVKSLTLKEMDERLAMMEKRQEERLAPTMY